MNSVITSSIEQETLQPILDYRRQLLSNHQRIKITDYGKTPAKIFYRSIAQIVQGSGKPINQAALLHQFAKAFQGTKIELGTNMGISTAHIALAEPNARIYTFEGATEIAELAKAFFNESELSNTELIVGNIDDTLPSLLEDLNIEKISLAFLDANHRYEPTLRYFELLKPYMAQYSVIIFDDIYHNPEMIKAWQKLCKTEINSLRLDFYFWGVIIKGSSQGHYKVHLKP